MVGVLRKNPKYKHLAGQPDKEFMEGVAELAKVHKIGIDDRLITGAVGS